MIDIFEDANIYLEGSLDDTIRTFNVTSNQPDFLTRLVVRLSTFFTILLTGFVFIKSYIKTDIRKSLGNSFYVSKIDSHDCIPPVCIIIGMYLLGLDEQILVAIF